MGGDYVLPWRQELLEVSGETLFDALLSRHLSPAATVLEAGCAGGRDAALYAPQAKHWTGYDFTPQFLETARGKGIPNASFVDWHSSREPIPDAILNTAPFDLIVSRRGPTSVIQHLPVLAAPNARFLYVGPRGADLLEEIRIKLEGVSWRIVWSAVIEAHGFLPSFEDYVLYAEFGNQPVSRTEFDSRATDHGFPFLETKCVIVAHST
jgi:SAM-dependent methyltransferase